MQAVLAILLLLLSLLSTFSLYVPTSARTANRPSLRSLVMRKGRKIPIDQRGEYLKQQKMLDMQSEMLKNKPTGVPIFRIYVRFKAGGLWIPAGDLAGDQRATALVNAWQSGFMEDMYRNQIVQGVARSIFSQEDTFSNNIIKNYKPFNKAKKEDLEFGFKVEFEGLDKKLPDQPITPLKRGMEKSWFDNVKDSVTNLFGEK